MKDFAPNREIIDELMERIDRINRANIDEKEIFDETEELSLAA